MSKFVTRPKHHYTESQHATLKFGTDSHDCDTVTEVPLTDFANDKKRRKQYIYNHESLKRQDIVFIKKKKIIHHQCKHFT